MSFCGHILQEVSMLQPAASEVVHADYHRARDLRSPVTVQVIYWADKYVIYPFLRFHAVFFKLQGSRPSY